MKRNKKVLALLICVCMIIAALPVLPVMAAETEIQIFEIGDMSVSSAATNVTFTTYFGGGEAPYTVVWQLSTDDGETWSAVQTTTLPATDSISYTIASVTTSMSGYKYRVAITDSEGTIGVSNAAMLTVTTASGTCSAPTVLTNATPASGGTVYRNEGLQIVGSEAWNTNMKLYVEYGIGAAASIPDPTMASIPYTGPIVVPSTATNGQTFTVKAIATSSTRAPSSVATFTWTVSTTVETLWDIKNDPEYILWRDSNYASDVPGITYKHDTHPVNGLDGVYGDTDFVPSVVYDKVASVITRLSASDKTNLLNGSSGKIPGSVWGTRSLLSYGIMSTATPDGPVGVSITSGGGTTTNNYERRMTWWPAGMAQAATWNKELNVKLGTAWGMEMAFFGVDMMLGPGMNLHRSILNGRNFEYYAEDPMLSGMTGGYVVKGMNTQNVSACIKHYMMNNQETGRSNRPTYTTTRALRELYGRNWEYVIDIGNPWGIMDAFNNVNGPHAAQHYDTNTTLARYEYGFNGWIMTDYGGYGNSTNSYNYTNGGTSAGASVSQSLRVKSGCDVMNPSNGTASVTAGATYITNSLSQIEQDQAVKRMMYYSIKGLNFNDKQPSMGETPQSLLDITRPIAAEVGNDSVTLLQNQDLANGKPALPIAVPTGDQQILMVGANNNTRIHGGSGSGQLSMNTKDSAITPTMITAIRNIAGTDNVTANTSASIAQSQWDTWSNSGTEFKAVIMSLSRTQGESNDVSTTNRATSAAEATLIGQASAFARSKGIPFILVLNMCNYIDMNAWVNSVDALIVDWYQGINGGAPSANVIFGITNPSGKLPDTIPIATTGNYAGNGSRYNPSEGQFGTSTDIYYYEDIYVGYRYYDTFNVPVQFPFGFGLSYTTFEYSGATLSKAVFDGVNDKITASVTVTNTGDVAGKETVEFYIGAPGVEIAKPVKELKGYDKTKLLEPGESQTLTVEFDAMSLASYHGIGNIYNGQWRVEEGLWVVYFASSAQDIRATKEFTVPATFTVKTALKAAAGAPYATNQTNLNNNLRTPTQVVVTFKPAGGGASFQKAYTYNAANYSDRAKYGYVPELPSGYAWVNLAAGGMIATAGTVVPTSAHTLEAVPFTLELSGNTLTASVACLSEGSTSATLYIAQYDALGRMLNITSIAAPVTVGVVTPISVTAALAANAATSKAFLWDSDTFIPLCSNVMISVG
ncbi:MAG: glycoside hydrolase family 3 C-terminal domain-containing protein [Oscillospiraceae bacterium]|nr:glycoside hydrolase family 3 C-terminal domain-containing protein [Oscillospiraceae bacterium]